MIEIATFVPVTEKAYIKVVLYSQVMRLRTIMSPNLIQCLLTYISVYNRNNKTFMISIGINSLKNGLPYRQDNLSHFEQDVCCYDNTCMIQLSLTSNSD